MEKNMARAERRRRNWEARRKGRETHEGRRPAEFRYNRAKADRLAQVIIVEGLDLREWMTEEEAEYRHYLKVTQRSSADAYMALVMDPERQVLLDGLIAEVARLSWEEKFERANGLPAGWFRANAKCAK